MELELTQRQGQVLSPQQMQAAALLQMGAQELRERVAEAVQENPMLELPEPRPMEEAELPPVYRLDWMAASDRQNQYYYSQDADAARRDVASDRAGGLDDEESLSRYLLSQFFGTDLEPPVQVAVEFLVERLDGNGFLDEEPAALAREAGVPMPVMDRALTELRAADPAGVGARDLADCLQIQLERRAGDHSLAIRIARQELDALAHGRYGLIARRLGVTEREARAACEIIRGLDPRPGAAFARRENLAYLTPDLLLRVFPDHFELALGDAALPELTLSPYYARMLRETDDPEVRDYLTERAKQAKELIQGIKQRQDTLFRCAAWVVEQQADFFRMGPGHLRPVTMEEAAAALEVHPSTVSRTVRDKYLQCPQGVYPLRWFFSRPVGDGASPKAAQSVLRSLVDGEKEPLSDQKLCEEMARLGCPVSRRTVAKYRAELGIPAASARRSK